MNLLAWHILRGAQLVLAIVVLGLGADAVTRAAFNSAAFIVFCSVWTLLVVLYFMLTPRFLEAAYHPWARVAIDAVTMLFWFSGFIALAVLVSYGGAVTYDFYGYGYWDQRFYRDGAAAAGLGGLEWILFVITTVFTSLEVFRGESHHSKRVHHNPNPANPEVQV